MVKIYDNTQVMRQSLNAPYANAESFGGALGRALEQAGQGLASIANQAFDIAKERKDEYDTTLVSEKDTELSEYSSKLLNGDILVREGKNAIGSSKEFEEAFDKKFNELSEKLENAAQQRLFAKLAKQRKEAYLNSTRSFERVQFQKYKQDNTQATVDNAIEEALANYTNDDLVQMSYNRGLAAIRANYLGQGELAAQKECEYKTSFYKPMIAKLSAEDAQKAESYYNAHKNDISASEHKAIEQMLYGDGMKQKSVKNAEMLWQSGKSEAEQIEAARQIKNIDERDMTINRIKSRWADKRRLDDIQKKENQEKQWEQFIKSNSAEEALDILSTVSDPHFRSTLEHEYGYRWLGQAKPNSYQRQRGLDLQSNNNKLTADIDEAIKSGLITDSIKQRIDEIDDEQVKNAYQLYISKGGIIETDSNTYVMLADLAQRRQTNFANLDLNHYIDRLSAADRAYLQAIQTDIQSQQMGEAGNGKYTQFLSSSDYVKRYMKLRGIEEADKPEEYYKAKIMLENAVNEFEAVELQGKRKASTQEIDTIITRMAGTFSQEGWEFYKDIRLSQIADEPVEKRAKVYQPFKKMSGNEINDLAGYLATYGITGDPTKDDELKELYQKMYPAILAQDRETMDYLIRQYKDAQK